MPLELAAAKSSVAHTEPAAGAVGLASAVARLRQTAATTFLHLRGLNPYVQSIAASVKGRHGWLARREQAAVPLLDDSRYSINHALSICAHLCLLQFVCRRDQASPPVVSIVHRVSCVV